MEIKGSAVATLPVFIKEKFGQENYDLWLNSLSGSAREFYSHGILVSKWYPLKDVQNEPIKIFCDLFYQGNARGAWELGRYNAEKSLKGIYSLFIKFGTPQFIINKGSNLLSTFCRPSKLEVTESGKNKVIIRITLYSEISTCVEYHIGGWIERAAELCGCKKVKVLVTSSLAHGDKFTEYVASWE